MDIYPYRYVIRVKRNNEWYGYSGFMFARNKKTGMELTKKRFIDGIIRSPYKADILPADEVIIESFEMWPVEEGTFL